jgi:fido (protein-threonine AMPylation protein)
MLPYLKYRPYLEARLSARLTAKKARLDRYRPLPPETGQYLLHDLKIIQTFHSTAIEGSTLDLKETELAIEHGLTSGEHPLTDYLAARGHAKAFDRMIVLVQSPNSRLTKDIILELHALSMEGVIADAGKFRKIQVFIRGAKQAPPPAKAVPKRIREWLAWLKRKENEYDPVTLAAISHHLFEAIHPFTDGNGRVGRLILNFMLVQKGYPPALILKDWRTGYISALQKADNGDYNPLVNIVGVATEEGLNHHLRACEKAGVTEWFLLSELAESYPYSVDYLGWLARHGRLEATKREGRWYSTKKAIEKYQEGLGEGKPGRKIKPGLSV